MIPIPADAAAALVAAGSTQIGAAARRELERRVTQYGVSERARNIGGIKCAKAHAHQSGDGCALWRGHHIEVFPDYATAARRIIRLCRLATGEAPATRPTDEGQTAGFRSIAPDEGEGALEISHVAGPDNSDTPERAALWTTLAGHLGSQEAAIARVQEWRAATEEQRDRVRANLSGLAGAGELTAADLLDELGATKKKKAKAKAKPKPKKKPKPSAAAVLHAKQKAKQSQAVAAAAKKKLAETQARLAELQQAQAQQAQAQQEQAQAAPPQDAAPPLQEGAPAQAFDQQAPPPQGFTEADYGGPDQGGYPAPGYPPAPGADPAEMARLEAEMADLRASVANSEILAQDAESQAQGLAGLFGPSDAAAHAFQDLAASWTARERAGVPAKYPFLLTTHNAWIAFRDAWVRGDEDETNLNAMIADARRCDLELDAKDPKWRQGAAVNTPKNLSLEQTHPISATVDRVVNHPVLAPLEALTNPFKGPIAKAANMAAGKAPWWHYALALAGVGGIGFVIVKVAKPF